MACYSEMQIRFTTVKGNWVEAFWASASLWYGCWREKDISGGRRDVPVLEKRTGHFRRLKRRFRCWKYRQRIRHARNTVGLYRGRCRFNLKNVWIHTMNSYRGSVEAEPTVVSFVSRLFLVSSPWRRETNTNNHFDHYWSMSSYNPLRILIIYAKYIGKYFAQFFSISERLSLVLIMILFSCSL